MRFMMIVKADKNYEAGVPPSQELMTAIGRLSQEMISRGKLLDTGGLLPSSAGRAFGWAGERSRSPTGPSPRPRN